MDIQAFYKTFFKPGNISTDSRRIFKGDIFIALRGENFNGNEYAQNALKAGACIAVIDDPGYKETENTILVNNSITFLQELAIYHRQHCTGHFIGLTGTNGKTTTKELIHAVLSEKYSCQATQANLNNHIGVPLTILSIRYDTEILIVEMGANHIGEIENLCNISQPDSGLITNIGKAHLEGFGSLEGVKKAKNELYHYLKNKGKTIYINGSDEILNQLLGTYHNVVKYNDQANHCDGRIINSENTLTLEINNQGNRITVNSKLHGDYNTGNILSAACIGLEFDLSLEQIKTGIEKYQPANQRSQLLRIGTTKIILDCYNANPTSMREAITSFLKIPSGKKIVVLGAMKELGEFSDMEHKNIGDLLKTSSIDHAFLIGEEFNVIRESKATNLADILEIKKYLQDMDLQNTAILVKGSRINKLERIQDFMHVD